VEDKVEHIMLGGLSLVFQNNSNILKMKILLDMSQLIFALFLLNFNQKRIFPILQDIAQ
jgi:hypothetical protein